MNTKRLGFLTPLALISAGITLVVIIALELYSGNSLFSPGALNAQTGQPVGGFTSHAAFGQECGKCHTAPWEAASMADRCMDCHTTIKTDLADPTSLHGAIAQSGSADCRECHSEHNGADAPLTDAEIANFPHDVVGYSLKAHQTNTNDLPFACTDCHTRKLSEFTQETCTDCHQTIDPAYMTAHLADFGADCLACHDGVDRYSDFDHDLLAFPLVGAHKTVECADCHPQAQNLTDLQQAPTACEDCHLDDPHQGRFGTACADCHTSEGWSPAKFDHNLSVFKLTGKHVDVACDSCHTKGYQGTPQDCYSCHQKDDKHSGQYGTACDTCHTTETWEGATFNHNNFKFKLTGAHEYAPCLNCHVNNTFKGTPSQCGSCHGEPAFHSGLFRGQSCSACHDTNAWRPAPYNGPHSFPFNHGGAGSCRTCHSPTLNSWTCYSCHNQNSIASKHREEGISNFGNCLSCHPTGQEGDDDGGGGDDD